MAHNPREHSDASPAASSSLFTFPPTAPRSSASHSAAAPARPFTAMDTDADQKALNATIFKGPKRKRLIKACDACHKSKRRCDGTAPCGNCYFASKECTYTDSAGRAVPAPNALRHESTASSSSSLVARAPLPALASTSTAGDTHLQSPGSGFTFAGTGPPVPSSSAPTSATRFILDDGKDHQLHSRKRPREDKVNHAVEVTAATVASTAPSRGQVVPALDIVPAGLSTADGYAGMERRHTWILVECQPFAKVALSALFDADRNLVAPFSLATAQALCLLQAHKIYVDSAMDGDFQFFDIALNILKELDVYKTDNPILTPIPPIELRQKCIERECMRRTVWYIHLIELLGSIFVHRPMTLKPQEVLLRLPCDEASFETACHLSVPEYLSITAPKNLVASEFGHVIRVARLLYDIEKENTEAPDLQVIAECQFKLNAWASTVAEHLRFTPENLKEHSELLLTGSNQSAWCYAFMHVLHAACVISLCDIRMKLGQPLLQESHAASSTVSAIITTVGPRARNSILMGMVLWLEYCGPHAPHLRLPPDEKVTTAGGGAIGSGSGISVMGGSGGGSGSGGSITVPKASGSGATSSANPAVVQAGGIDAGSGDADGGNDAAMRVRTWIPDLQPQLQSLVKEWEELWGPVRMHARPGASGASGSGAGAGMAYGGQQPQQRSQTQWAVHEGVIDPLLRGGGRPQSVHAQLQPSVPPSQSLPSLKASGLLDVGVEGNERSGNLTGSRGSWSRGGDVGVQPSSTPALSPSGLAIPAPPSGVVQAISGPVVGPGMAAPLSSSSHRGSMSAPTTPSDVPGGYPTRVYTHTSHTHTQAYFVDHAQISPPIPTSTFRSPPPHAASPRSRRASRAPPPHQSSAISPALSSTIGHEPAIPPAQPTSSTRR